MSAPSPDEVRFILESGISAPSADNHHPLRFEVTADGLRLWYSEQQLPEPGSYKRVIALLSLGAVLENLAIAASRFGIGAEAQAFPDLMRPRLVSQVIWQSARVKEDPLWAEIPRRHTNRTVFFHGPSMSREAQSTLARAAIPDSGCDVVWVDEPRLKAHVFRLMRLAEGARFRTPRLHAELFSTIHFEAGWQQSCEEGLPPGALGIERPLRPAFALLRHWPLMRLFNLLGAFRLLGWRAADLPCRLAPHVGLITVDTVDDKTIVAAGRAFQRIWLGTTQLGMALQPMPASALFALPGAIQEGVPKPLQQHLNESWRALFPARSPVMLFRVGRAAPPQVLAGRKGLNEYLLDESRVSPLSVSEG
ncbi:MAG: hypothetical protein ACLPXB_18965 [Thiobacillaceae bacterium]